MASRRITTVIAAALLSATVVGASPALADEEVVQTPAEAQATDQKAIAEARGWTVAQARAHIEASDEARRIGREIRKKRPDIFIGAALSEKPLGAPSVYVKGPAPKFVKELIATADYPMKLVDDQPYSRDELHARADKVFESLLDAGYRQVTTDVDITGAGMIPVAVLETPGKSSKRADILADVPSGLRDSVELTVSTKPFGEGDHARGGPAVYPPRFSDVATPEGTQWYLTAYAEGQELTDVPWYVAAGLVLEDGQILGSTGCGEMYAVYWIDGATLAVDRPEITDIGCDGEPERVQAAYLAALPTTMTWTVEDSSTGDHHLRLHGPDGGGVLVFTDTEPTPSRADLAALALQLDTQQAEIARLTRQVDKLRKQVRQLEGQ